jgi:polyhydroxyalkanoate synthesis regulator phasin
VVESIKTGEAKGYEAAGAAKPKSEAEIRCVTLTEELSVMREENAALKRRIAELEAKVTQLEGVPKSRQLLADAQLIDGLVNGPEA